MAKEDYTVTYSKDPEVIEKVGDKTLLQQSYFVGAALKFFSNTKPETEAGYIIAGNYPDISNDLKYGKLEYYPFAPRELFGPNPDNFAEGTTTIPVLKTEINKINGNNRMDSTAV
jgi:hypothetical protein